MKGPISTYRLQLHQGFPLSKAAEVADYVAELGATDLYTSPILRAETGSTHGYNVCDYAAIGPDLGGEEAFVVFTAARARAGLGHVLDIVPNHMGIAAGENAMWNDVLENGPSSRFADVFDIEWSPPTPGLENRLLYPLLGAQYGEVLENGELQVHREGGAFVLSYYDHRLPLAPRSLIPLLAQAEEQLPLPEGDPARDELRSIVTALRHLPNRDETAEDKRKERAREKEIVKRRLLALCSTSKEAARAVDEAVEKTNGQKGHPRSFDDLDTLLREQNYRLAFWRVATDEINYRRFFDVNELVAVRMESPEVFALAHARVFALAAAGQLTGLRLDHTDGLYDPADYFQRLRAHGAEGLYVVAEKILERGEALPRGWAIEGTTGYDAMAELSGVFVDARAEAPMTALYRRATGDMATFAEHVQQGKRDVLRASFAGEINVLALALQRLAQENRRSRDFTLRLLNRTLSAVIAAFPVYRTYLRPDGTREPNDERHVERAFKSAQKQNPEMDVSAFDFLRDVVLLRAPAVSDAEREAQVRVAMRFQQLTGPIMAKGVEDTAFYRYHRLVGLNEVGGSPGDFGVPVTSYHAANERRLQGFPRAMTASSTHDTKRGEDVRARLATLTEFVSEWDEAVLAFQAVAARHTTLVDDESAPGAGDQYLFFQTVFGATPFDSSPEGNPGYADRLVAYMAKATKEAKLRTSWLKPNAAYDAAIEAFIRAMMGDAEFTSAVTSLAAKSAPETLVNALGQVALKLCAPGVPDTYQGCERWNFSLVDPDNRRPVDYSANRAMLGGIKERAGDPLALAADLLRQVEDGAVKLYVTHRLLAARRDHPELFIEGRYERIEAGPHVIGFMRASGEARLLCFVPRLVRGLLEGGSTTAVASEEGLPFPLPLGARWGDARVNLPASFAAGAPSLLKNVFTGERLEAGASLRLADVFEHFPVAVLLSS